MAAERSCGYAFGNFRLYPEEALLLRSEQPVPLPPKTFKILCFLVENRGHLVDKDTLMHAVWPDTFVVENNLRYNISILRRALGDNRNGTRFIETSPKLGYRFVSEIREIVETAETPIQQQPEPEDTAVPGTPSWPAEIPGAGFGKQLKVILAGAALVVVALSYFGSVVVHRLRAAVSDLAKSGSIPMSSSAQLADIVVVLPFKTLRPDPESDFLGVALARATTGQLSYSSRIVVHPSTPMLTLNGTDPDLELAPEATQRQVLVTGSYVKERENIRLFLNIATEPGHAILWHGDLVASTHSLMSLQDLIAEQIGFALHVEVHKVGGHSLTDSNHPSNRDDYEDFLHGLGASEQSIPDAIRWHEKVLSVSPDLGQAVAYLAFDYAAYCYQQSALLVPPTMRESRYLDRSVELYRRAMERDVVSPQLLSIGGLYFLELNRLDDSVVLLRRALQLNPNYAQAHLWLSQAYRYGGNLEESRSEAELALRLDPEIREHSTLNTYLYMGEYDKFLENFPRRQLGARVLFYRGLAHYYKRDLAQAERDFRASYEMQPEHPHAQYAHAFLESLASENAEGIRQLRLFEKNYFADGEMIYKTAQAYAVLGDKESALRLLRQSIDHDFFPYGYFKQDPLLDSIRNVPEYWTAMERARARHEAFLHKFFPS